MKNCEKKDQTLNKIYNAVQELLLEKGNNLSVKDICLRASIGVGTFYHYYKTKEEAILDISNPIDVYFKKNVIPSLDGKPAVQKLKIFFMYQAQFITDYVLINGNNNFLRAIQANLEHFFSENRLTFSILNEIVSDPSLYANWKKKYSNEMITWHLLHLTRGLIHHWLGNNCNYILREELLAHIDMTLSL